MESEELERVCRKCGGTKPLCNFSQYGRDGLRRRTCRACRYAGVDKDKKAEYQRAYLKTEKGKQVGARQRAKPGAKDRAKERSSKSYEKNKEKVLAMQRERKALQHVIEYRAAAVKKWGLNNRARKVAASAEWRARLARATPSWADKSAVQRVYQGAVELGRVLGISFHVDHVVPLKSDKVCGLHCEANLQILAADENVRKLNHFWPDMPEEMI